MTEDLSQEDINLLKEAIGDVSPTPEEKANIFSIFRRIIAAKDSSKVSNVSQEELGDPKITIRGYQSVAEYARIMELDEVSKYLLKEAEIVLATSLSKEGFLTKTIVTSKKELLAPDEQTKRKVNKGWFNKKD